MKIQVGIMILILLLDPWVLAQTHVSLVPGPKLRAQPEFSPSPSPSPIPVPVPVRNPGKPFQPRPRQFKQLPLGLNATGPESVAFDCQGHGPYVGVADGRILRWESKNSSWVLFAVTDRIRKTECNGVKVAEMEAFCGRPLALKFHPRNCELYVVDSTYGLIKFGRGGGDAIVLARYAEGIFFSFLNGLDIDSEGDVVYFTDTSTEYRRWSYETAMGIGDRSGRLIKYDIKTEEVTVLLRALSFANGVALSKNKDFVLVSETIASQITRLWLKGPKTGVSEKFLALDGGRPDNINRNAKGEFWIAQNPNPPIKVDEQARILEVLNGGGKILDDSDVSEVGNTIWIGSVVQSYLLYAS